jgi:hypothetical protein
LGVSVLVSDGDDGAPGFYAASGNCPVDKDTYCPVGGCEHNTTECGSITIVHQTNGHRCVYPSGSGADECYYILKDQNALAAITAFFVSNSKCDLAIETDASGMNHIYSTCACSQLKTEIKDKFRVSGFSFSRKNGPVFVADFPTSSPWGNSQNLNCNPKCCTVTSVGASQFIVNSQEKIVKEVACSIQTGALITTGGGFSSYQAQVKPLYTPPNKSSHLTKRRLFLHTSHTPIPLYPLLGLSMVPEEDIRTQLLVEQLLTN